MRAIALFLVLTSTGCSILFMERAPQEPKEVSYPKCSEGGAAVGMDVVSMIVLTTLGITAIANGADTGGGIALGLAGLHGLSASIGSRSSRRCKEQRIAYLDHTKENHRELVLGLLPANRAVEAVPARVVGVLNSACYPNTTCNEGLYCEVESNRCLRGNVGLQGGSCRTDQTCTQDLLCIRHQCVARVPIECRANHHCNSGSSCQHGYCR